MRRLVTPAKLAVLAMLSCASAALARDAETVLRGSLLDALVDFREDERGEDAPVLQRRERLAAVTNPTRPERRTRADDPSATPAVDEASDDDDDDDEAESDDGETSFDFALRHGYDSNYDVEPDGEGSAFTELSTSGSITREIGDTTVFAQGNASFLSLPNLEQAERPLAESELAIRQVLDEGRALTTAFGVELDGTGDPTTLSNAVSAGFEIARPDIGFAVRASYDTEIAVREIFDNDGALGVFDFQRPAVEASLLIAPDARIAPYASIGLSRILFFDPLPSGLDDDVGGIIPSPERNATQATGALGLQMGIVDDLVIRTGARVTARDFDERGLTTKVDASPEIEATWTLPNDLTLSGSYQRTLSEPDTLGSLAQDIQSAGLSFEYAPDAGLGVEMTGEFERTREVGIPGLTDDVSFGLVAKYRAEGQVFVELGVLQSWSFDRLDDDDARGLQIAGGVGTMF